MRRMALTQGMIYIATGLWPIVHLRSFEWVTGPKPEGWLVKTTGALIATIGTALVIGARERPSRALRFLGIGAAAALGGSALYYAAKRRISPIYFADAALEGALIAGWTIRNS